MGNIRMPIEIVMIPRYSLGAITQLFVGHANTLALAAVYIKNLVIASFSFGAWVACTAFGVGQLDMLGVYMKRSYIILNPTMVVLLYVFATQILKLIGQMANIFDAAEMLAL
ncbi:hypothetical protein SAY86_016254 [Trapa natans]|uniref:Uncharacterized protein n=1 Tax=Trapa natans TaxID=22666 RepID=A0AAN7LL37_TRANT|nr:hypothetical protein SAY86_016254 [Trapa natans]